MVASKLSLPRDCENRCTEGVHPPDMPTQSQASVRRGPMRPSLPSGATIRPVTRLRPGRADHGVAGQNLHALCPERGKLRPAIGVEADIDDGDGEPRRPRIRRRLIGRGAAGGEDDAAARRHRIAVDEGAHALGQHDAGAVVVGEHQRALMRSGRQHHLLRAHLPQPFARQIGWGVFEVVADALGQGDVVVIVIAEGRGTRQQGDVLAGA